MKTKRVAVLLSIVLWSAGMALAQTEWDVDHPQNPVLGPGEPGSWDEDGRMAGAVVFDGSIWHVWYVNFSWDIAGGTEHIGHAKSMDGGVTWHLDPANPVLEHGEPGEWDGDRLFLPTVIYDGVQFHMWYSGVQGDYVQGGYATSPDGTIWTKYFGNPVLPSGLPGSWDELNARPGAVVADGDTLKMWYSGLGTNNHIQIGYAESIDGGITWIKHPEPVLQEIFASVWDQRVCNPAVVFTGSTYHMWYAGYNVPDRWWRTGYAFSPDGIHWTRNGDPVISFIGEHTIASPVLYDGSVWRMWYGHYTFDFSLIASSYAWSTCCAGLFADDFETGDTSLWSMTGP